MAFTITQTSVGASGDIYYSVTDGVNTYTFQKSQFQEQILSFIFQQSGTLPVTNLNPTIAITGAGNSNVSVSAPNTVIPVTLATGSYAATVTMVDSAATLGNTATLLYSFASGFTGTFDLLDSGTGTSMIGGVITGDGSAVSGRVDMYFNGTNWIAMQPIG